MSKKVVFITGAFGLIGYSLSKYFLRNNYCVILSDIDSSKISSVKADLTNNEKFDNDSFLVLELDITNKDSVEDSLKLTIKKFKKVDILINNAAIDAKFDKTGFENIDNNSFENYPIDLLEKSIRVNTIGTVLVTQIFCKQMLLQGFGNIINVASTYALISPNQNLYDFNDGNEVKYKPVDYIVSKSFVPNFTRYISTFYARKNIRCNAIAPHGIYNNHDEKFLKNFSELSPIGRMCEVEELHSAFKFLADEESKYMTGSTIVIDGGWTAW